MNFPHAWKHAIVQEHRNQRYGRCANGTIVSKSSTYSIESSYKASIVIKWHCNESVIFPMYVQHNLNVEFRVLKVTHTHKNFNSASLFIKNTKVFAITKLTFRASAPSFSMALRPCCVTCASSRVRNSPRPLSTRDTSWYIRPRSAKNSDNKQKIKYCWVQVKRTYKQVTAAFYTFVLVVIQKTLEFCVEGVEVFFDKHLFTYLRDELMRALVEVQLNTLLLLFQAALCLHTQHIMHFIP